MALSFLNLLACNSNRGGDFVAPASSDEIRTIYSHESPPFLCGTRPIRHEFHLSNPTDRPVRLTGGFASTPCCSEIGPLPAVVPPGGSAIVPVFFRPGNQSGNKRVEFTVTTDRPVTPKIELSLTVPLMAGWEVASVGEAIRTVRMGSTTTQTFRVTCRSKGADGQGAPSEVRIAGPFSCGFTTDLQRQEKGDGIIEESRDVEVSLADTTKAGHRSAELVFAWPDGATKAWPVHWEVIPHVRVAPATLIVASDRSPSVATIEVASEGPPIRILRVTGPLV